MSYHLLSVGTIMTPVPLQVFHCIDFSRAFSTENGFCRTGRLQDFPTLHLLSLGVQFVNPSIKKQVILGIQTKYFHELTLQKSFP